MISENQGLFQTLEKFQVLQNWIFFLGLHLEKKLDLYHKPEKNPGDKLKKKSRCAGPEIFLRLETDLNFSRPRFYEIKVQLKRPTILLDSTDFHAS